MISKETIKRETLPLQTYKGQKIFRAIPFCSTGTKKKILPILLINQIYFKRTLRNRNQYP